MRITRKFITVFAVLLIASALLVACKPSPENPNLILATTTSTQDSGLLDEMIPEFEKATGYTVQTIAVGSGEAMKMGQECNADVLLVHSPAAEKDFMANNYGSDRRLVMHNDFIIVGPSSDPAGIKTAATSAEAFTKIADSKSPFISRADKSGTNSKELAIWKSLNITPEGDWYIRNRSGHGSLIDLLPNSLRISD
jgi:tungstate transport system substrate-binding protein